MTTPRLPREDLTAAMAARRELGPDYDDAFIETVVDRIEEASAPAPPPRRGPGTVRHRNRNAAASTITAWPWRCCRCSPRSR